MTFPISARKKKNKRMFVAVREFMTIGSGEMSPFLWIPMYIAPVVWFMIDRAVFDVFFQNLQGNLFFLAIIAVLTSVIAAFYYIRMVKSIFFDDPTEELDILNSLLLEVL